jgi:hypothetical protein
MAIYVTALSQARLADPPPEDDEECEPDNACSFVPSEGSFPVDSLDEGYYLTEGRCHSFQAGTNSGYCDWCEALCMIADLTQPVGYTEVERIAFSELIDCGTFGGFGPITAAKLLEDFRKCGRTAKRYFRQKKDRRWMVQNYDDHLKALEIAADKGCFMVY